MIHRDVAGLSSSPINEKWATGDWVIVVPRCYPVVRKIHISGCRVVSDVAVTVNVYPLSRNNKSLTATKVLLCDMLSFEDAVGAPENITKIAADLVGL